MGTERQQLWVVAVRASAKAARATAKAKAKARERERAMAKERKGKEDPRSLSSLIVMRACSSPRARRTHCVPVQECQETNVEYCVPMREYQVSAADAEQQARSVEQQIHHLTETDEAIGKIHAQLDRLEGTRGMPLDVTCGPWGVHDTIDNYSQPTIARIKRAYNQVQTSQVAAGREERHQAISEYQAQQLEKADADLREIAADDHWKGWHGVNVPCPPLPGPSVAAADPAALCAAEHSQVASSQVTAVKSWAVSPYSCGGLTSSAGFLTD